MNEKNGLFYAGNRIDAECCLVNSVLSAFTYLNYIGTSISYSFQLEAVILASKIHALS